LTACLFQRSFEELLGMRGGQQRLTPVTTKCHEVKIAGLLISL
jgi:hypothetical protein